MFITALKFYSTSTQKLYFLRNELFVSQLHRKRSNGQMFQAVLNLLTLSCGQQSSSFFQDDSTTRVQSFT